MTIHGGVSVKLETFLITKFSNETTKNIIEKQEKLIRQMSNEQRDLLTESQYVTAKRNAFSRIALYLAMREQIEEDVVLEYLKEYYYAKLQGAVNVVNFLGRTKTGCNIFQKLYSSTLNKDTWILKIMQNDNKALVFDIKKCLYKDLCDYYNCPKCCHMFCDADWFGFGNMKN